jgi:hypothetical protein
VTVLSVKIPLVCVELVVIVVNVVVEALTDVGK